MNVEERRIEIVKLLQENEKSISGKALADYFDISRQVIVKDIGILKAQGVEIISTNRGYTIKREKNIEQIVKVIHDKQSIEKELNLLVDNNITIVDVFVIHLAYGKIKRNLNIKSRNGVKIFVESLKDDSPLLKLTSGVHFHTLRAKSRDDLEKGIEELRKAKFLLE